MNKEQMIAEVQRLNAELDKIYDAEWKQRNKDLVGKCFKYSNSYGQDKRWWLYARVIKAKSKHDTTVFQFQTDCHGKVEVEGKNRMSPTFIGSSSWRPITLAEFQREWKKVQHRVAKIAA